MEIRKWKVAGKRFGSSSISFAVAVLIFTGGPWASVTCTVFGLFVIGKNSM
jgi:hypothetical protein